MKKESIALNPICRPKNNSQFMTKRIPYWKTVEYKKLKGGNKNDVQ